MILSLCKTSSLSDHIVPRASHIRCIPIVSCVHLQLCGPIYWSALVSFGKLCMRTQSAHIRAWADWANLRSTATFFAPFPRQIRLSYDHFLRCLWIFQNGFSMLVSYSFIRFLQSRTVWCLWEWKTVEFLMKRFLPHLQPAVATSQIEAD